MIVQLCLGFVVGVMATLAFVDVRCHQQFYADLRMCMRQFEAMETYFVGGGAGELRVHCRGGFLTFDGGQFVGYRRYESI